MKSVRDQDPNDKMGTTKRIQAILTGIIDEEPLSHIPLNYDIAFICSSIKSHNPEKRNLIYAFQKLGYKCIQTYYNPKYWKIDAPPEIIYDVFKAYKKSSGHELLANLKEGTPGYRIFSKPMINENYEFDHTKATKEDMTPSKKKKQKKYYDNPAPNWGPKPRATGK